MNDKQDGLRAFYLWTRDLHLYFGLFLCPYVLVFCVSTVVLNHRWEPVLEPKVSEAVVNPPQAGPPPQQGQEILRQLGISGELGGVRTNPEHHRLTIQVWKPGEKITIESDTIQGNTRVMRRHVGLLDALIFMHMMPGPHRTTSPTWVLTKIWSVLTDTIVYALLFLSITGIYLWTALKAERKIGVILLSAGMLSFLAVLGAFVYL